MTFVYGVMCSDDVVNLMNTVALRTCGKFDTVVLAIIGFAYYSKFQLFLRMVWIL